MNLDITVHYQPTTKVKLQNEELQAIAQNMEIKQKGLLRKETTCTTVDTTVNATDNTITFKNNGETCKIEQDTDYIIRSTKDSENTIQIHTPRQETIGEEVYAVIGDGVNIDTDVNDSVPSDIARPSTVSNTYGIYELESIGYEKANPNTTESASTSKADWTENDLTLTKYDHIIRPINGNYYIENDIDASTSSSNSSTDNAGGFGEDGYRPIGQKIGTTSEEKPITFTGTILGNEDMSIIYNLYINQPELNNIGMIGITTGDITNIGLQTTETDKVYVTGNTAVGAIAGYVNGGEIDNTFATTDVTGLGEGKYNFVGGLVGGIDNGTITNSYTTGNIIGNLWAGGITGDLEEEGTITNSYATGTIKAERVAGGLVGYSKGIINNSYATGNITSNSYAGGLVGDIQSGEVNNSYATGNTEGETYGGGLVGYNSNGTINNSYATGNVLGDSNVGGLVGYNIIGTINNSYATGDASGSQDNVGGLVGYIYTAGTTENVAINNSYATGNVSGNSGVGGLVGEYNTRPTIDNSYGYYSQKVNGETVTNDNSLLVGSGSAVGIYIADYADLTSASWYNSTTVGNGLGWDSTATANDEGVDWTAPWSKDSLTCYPHIMTVEQDGTYVGGQEDECEEIINLVKELSYTTQKEQNILQSKDIKAKDTADISSMQQGQDSLGETDNTQEEKQDEHKLAEDEDNNLNSDDEMTEVSNIVNNI
ncbi:MAG: GLUG motif-containing protein [Mycoplasmatales bacterium]